ncbi:MAG: hypothetical protein R2856_07815 [Caldilineaceae bacterium]
MRRTQHVDGDLEDPPILYAEEILGQAIEDVAGNLRPAVMVAPETVRFRCDAGSTLFQSAG